jgi:phosphohistidine swiveling domain-containing protein
VQSRDITSRISVAQTSLAVALDRAAEPTAEEILFEKNELSEMLPRPTPLSFSLMESLWASGGSVDLASRALGLSYSVDEDAASYLVTILGRLYADRRQERARALNISRIAAWRLLRQADRIERRFRDEFLPGFLAELRQAEAIHFDELSTPDLFAALAKQHDKFVHATHTEVDIINIAAGVYVSIARERLSRIGLDPSIYLGRLSQTAEQQAILAAARVKGDVRRQLLIAAIGHRAVLDYELSAPRYSEAPQGLDRLVMSHRAPNAPYEASPTVAEASGEEIPKSIMRVLHVARRFQVLKEDAHHHSLREFALLRRIVLAIDRRLALGGLSFFLEFDELMGAQARSLEALRGLADRRQQECSEMLDLPPLAPYLSARDLEVISASGKEAARPEEGSICGTRVSGSASVEGRARVIAAAHAERGSAIEDFADGDIIVASMIHPAWLPYFARAGGFVSEVGGWLSHTAILAREFDVAMIVGTHGLAAIKDGMRLRLHSNGAVECLAEQSQVLAVA